MKPGTKVTLKETIGHYSHVRMGEVYEVEKVYKTVFKLTHAEYSYYRIDEFNIFSQITRHLVTVGLP